MNRRHFMKAFGGLLGALALGVGAAKPKRKPIKWQHVTNVTLNGRLIADHGLIRIDDEIMSVKACSDDTMTLVRGRDKPSEDEWRHSTP